MTEKNSKNSFGEAAVDEVWTAGGQVWINFANTAALASKGMTDVIGSSESLHWWFGTMGLSAPNNLGKEDLRLAASVREAFSRVLDNIEHISPLANQDLDLFNSILEKQREWYKLVQVQENLVVKEIHRSAETIEQALGPAVDSLSETLTKGDLSRLRTCAHPECVLRFYDDSKNGVRRWCTMSGCGNRAKAAAFLQRKKVKA